QVLNEIRVGHACRLLMEGEQTITEICYQSGFHSLSYFNRRFKLIMKMSPRTYKEKFSL
ncbi:MAG: helix-turn-helix domain-containing protein, partial [Bacteroidota bacterium]